MRPWWPWSWWCWRVCSALSGPGGDFPATYELTITGGTGSYQLATGTLVLDAVWNDPVIPVFAMVGTVSGTVVLPPPTPISKDDCRHGGWRNLADEHGRPFRNQGHCTTWVHHHL